MNLLAQAQHFVRPPDWTWYIVPYFFLAGLSGGSYVIATLLRLGGNRADEAAARLGYYVSFITFLPCPILLTFDLTQPLRFWHMLWNTTPGSEGFNFKYWSPMSVGSWALVLFGLFTTVSFVETLVRDRRLRARLAVGAVRPLGGALGKLWSAVGAVFGLFIAGYTGVLLAVSNQPVWSDTWTLGGLFLASGLSGSVALLMLLLAYRPNAQASGGMLEFSERWFAALELVLIIAFVVTLIPAGTLAIAVGFPWAVLWLIALVGVLLALGPPPASARLAGGGTAVVHQPTLASMAISMLILIGVLALRAAVILSPQL